MTTKSSLLTAPGRVEDEGRGRGNSSRGEKGNNNKKRINAALYKRRSLLPESPE